MPPLDIVALREKLRDLGVRRIAIDGCGGSGKSTLARQLAEGWPRAVVVEVDDFYRRVADRPPQTDGYGTNWDRERLAVEVLEAAVEGQAGRYQRYDWDEDRLAEWQDVPADGVIIVEGCYSTSQPLRGYFAYTIWVDTPYDVRLERGVERDGETMRRIWVEEWMPAEDRYIAAERPDTRADLVVSGAAQTDDAIVFKILVEVRASKPD